MERSQTAQRVLGWLIMLGATLQFFLAGLAVFGSSSFDVHRVVGDALILMSFALFVVAIVNREQLRLALLLFVLMLVQYGLAKAGDSVPALGGLHPLNGIAIIAISHFLARGPARPGGRHRRKKGAAPSPEEPAPARG